MKMEEQEQLGPSGGTGCLPPQILQEAVFSDISEHPVPQSIIRQACTLAGQSSYVLTEEQFQAFESQSLEVRQQSIRIFLVDLAGRGPDFGVARPLCQEELSEDTSHDEEDVHKNTYKTTGDISRIVGLG